MIDLEYLESLIITINAFTEKGLEYDRNGNITALTRYGTSASSAEDNFAFTLTGNRISSLTNSGTNGSGVTYTSFTYDANGNTTHDGRTGQDISWNMLNLISGISTTSGGNTTQLASYNWYADGTKYSAERSDGSGYVYKGSVIYGKAAGGSLSLDCVLTTGGRIVANKNSSGTITGYTVYHHITDHLGSVRAITNANTGTVVETSDFQPFGTRWSQTSGSPSATITDATNRWRYSGKEEQKAINSTLPLIDYGARMYDPTIARWMNVDPMAEKYYHISPYSYCEDNPINFFDPDGRGPIGGALFGAGLDVGIQITTNLINGEKWYKIDAKSVAISAGAGAAGVGLVSKVKQAAYLYKISKTVATTAEVLTEATVSGAESAVKQYVSDGTVSVDRTVKDAAIGAASSGAGQIAKNMKRVSGSSELKVLERQHDRLDRVAGQNPRPSRQAKENQARRAVDNYGDGAKEGAKALTTIVLKAVETIHEENKKD